MRLTSFTDYALRVLIHLALYPDRMWSIAEIAHAHGLSHNHLTKVISLLSREGYLHTARGRSGGVRLARPADSITVGEVVRDTEDGFELADCPGCVLFQTCGLTAVFNEGARAMVAVFDGYRISDLLGAAPAMRRRIEARLPETVDN